MCIKNFQKLNVYCDNGYQISLITAFQLCRGQTAQGTEHLIAVQKAAA